MRDQSLILPQPKATPAQQTVVQPEKEREIQEADTPLLQLLIQTKLTIGAADDPMEDEADAMADTVMRMRETTPSFIQRKEISIQRQFGKPEEGEGENKQVEEAVENANIPEEEEVQRKPLASFIEKKQENKNLVSGKEVTNKIQATRGNGLPLDGSTKSFMESRFGTDFSNVRIHTGDEAVQMSRELHAQAFTVGNDIYFNQGRYAPALDQGKQLIAHELTHTIQQGVGIRPKTIKQEKGERIQRSFLGDIWNGIRSAAGTVWNGITAGASAVWSGIRAIGRWGWDVIGSAGSWIWDFITWMPRRLWSLISHLGSGVADVGLWIADIVRVISGDEGLLHWLGRALFGGAAWVARFVAKVADVAGIGELWSLISNVIKFNTRLLTDTEREEARKVFGSSISYWQVRVDEHSLISTIGAYARSASGMGVTTAHTINFNKVINATPGSADMAWLIHEMGHVAQYTHVGLQYLGEAIHAQGAAGYDYGGGAALAGKDLRDFNREQQPDILKDYYIDVVCAPDPSPYSADYIRMKNQAQSGEF